MTTLIRPRVEAERPRPEPRQEETIFICANPDHHLLAAHRERMRLRDHRFIAPAGRIPEHDYCGAEAMREAIHIAGRPAFCALDGDVDDHEWRAAPVRPS
ncbi:MAG TPA: hypothetical protein VGR87_01230 [Candidatus Limnocylindria bacterium]|jgi:hypothetical protein|nr:hypothetical protein [Candidatus Limnocylindria bacterium]